MFVAEHAPPSRTGLACGIITSGLTIGILFGSLIAMAMNLLFTPQQLESGAWRIPFLIGGVFGLVAMYLRRWLHETPVFSEMQARKALSAELPLKAVLRGHRLGMAVSMAATAMLSVTIVVVILMTPTFCRSSSACRRWRRCSPTVWPSSR